MITQLEYNELMAQNSKASRENDYSKMIIQGSDDWNKLREYEQEVLCQHPYLGSDGGAYRCSKCGKIFE